MSEKTNPRESLATFNRREQFVEAFEQACLAGEQPQLEDFLPGPGPDRLPVLVDLIRVDLECRLKAGQGVRIEDYLERFPELKDQPAEIENLRALEQEHQGRRITEVPVGNAEMPTLPPVETPDACRVVRGKRGSGESPGRETQ